MKTDNYGCRAQLNPNGSDLRCGDKRWDRIQLCEMCQLKKRNASLTEMLNRSVKND